MTTRQKAVVFLFVSAMAAALWGVYHWGAVIRRQAVENWLEKADEDAQRITATSLNGLSLFQTQLRGMATLFYGSRVVVQDEFLNAIDLVEGLEVEAMVPLTVIAYAEQRSSMDPPQETKAGISRFPVTLSSDTGGLLKIGADLAGHRQVYSAIRSALLHPEKVVQGPVFQGENNRIFTTFCVTAPNAGKPGVLLSIVDITNFLDNLGILCIPEGLNLRIVERGAERTEASDRIIHGDQRAPAQAVATAYIPTQSGQAHWDYFWDILPGYAGGPAAALGTVIQLGGSALVLAMFAIIAFLLLQNIQVNRMVAKRTEDLVVATKSAEAANEAKSDFLARMSHEIRTPLNAVTGLTSIVLKSDLTAGQRDYLDKVRMASNNLLGIINDILDFSKVEAGRLELEKHPFDLDHVMEQLADLFSNRVAPKDLELIFITAPDVHRQLAGDAGRLVQVLTNLIENAVKFTDAGEIVVGVETQVQVEPHPGQTTLKFWVRDTGTGIAANVRPTLFEPFTQAEGYLTRKHEGTGLGLAICRRLVELMGGRIWVESTPGQGSTFLFTVPFKARMQQECPIRLPADLHGRKALVADDSAMARQVLVNLLESFTFNVTRVDSGAKAIAELHRAADGEPYQLVLLDWKMPGMNGVETAMEIRNDPNLHVPFIIIMVTAHDWELAEKCIHASAADSVLLKPIKPSQLLNTIMDLFRQPEVGKGRRTRKPPAGPLDGLAGRRVLVAEDSELNRVVAVALLEAAGLIVETAENGRIAVDRVTGSPRGCYSAVLMDIQMPLMDGYEATRRIREWEGQQPETTNQEPETKLPIIALTAHALKGEKEKCLTADMTDYLAKPIDEQELRRVLHKWIAPKQNQVSVSANMPISKYFLRRLP